MLNLARICFAARKFNDAREFCDALYVICNKIYDSNDIRLFTFREIFIQVCVEQKDYDLADAEYLRADLMDNPKITEERKLNIKMAFCSMLINKFLDVTIKNVMPYENPRSRKHRWKNHSPYFRRRRKNIASDLSIFFK